MYYSSCSYREVSKRNAPFALLSYNYHLYESVMTTQIKHEPTWKRPPVIALEHAKEHLMIKLIKMLAATNLLMGPPLTTRRNKA